MKGKFLEGKLRLFFCIFFIFTVVFSGFSGEVFAAEKKGVRIPSVRARAYVLMDALTGEVLLEKNSTGKIYPASTTKLLTAVVAVEQAPLDKKIKVKSEILRGIAWDAYKIGLQPGMQYRLDTLLKIMLIPSAADAADTIAVGVSGSRSEFIRLMNKKAKELGMKHSSFDNTIGLDIGNGYRKIYSTAYDMALLARYVMNHEVLRPIVGTPTYTYVKAKDGTTELLKSSNWFLSPTHVDEYWSTDYQVIGTKTGTTNAAGKCLIATAMDADGHELIAAVFGAADRAELYQDVKLLLDQAFLEVQEGDLTAASTFLDTRLLPQAVLLGEYREQGILEADKKGMFQPFSYGKQSWFYEVADQIAGTDLYTKLKKGQRKEPLTLSALAEHVFTVYPYPVTKKEIKSAKKKIQNLDDYTEEEIERLTALYVSGLLSEQSAAFLGSDRKITKVEMVEIADRMKEFFEGYEFPEEETEEEPEETKEDLTEELEEENTDEVEPDYEETVSSTEEEAA